MVPAGVTVTENTGGSAFSKGRRESRLHVYPPSSLSSNPDPPANDSTNKRPRRSKTRSRITPLAYLAVTASLDLPLSRDTSTRPSCAEPYRSVSLGTRASEGDKPGVRVQIYPPSRET